ncbi:unnamed protein product [Mytilus coruscus]|uniref:Nucleotidyltransferase domain-containing protein n=1 Tax=Mytilus coruscus TaxID=42192 RepID=A0A6J8E3P2_MYTCO|nr:unnamed protein product [Mytilus coruscus]
MEKKDFKIGSEEIVRIRRLSQTIIDIGQTGRGVPKVIHSGSKGEGLDLKGSDLDIMFIDANFNVYKSETEIVHDGLTIPLIVNTEETQPCFAQLSLLDNDHPFSKIMSQKNHLGYMLSNEHYKQLCMQFYNAIIATNYMKIHGPCLSDISDKIDLAYCLQCNKWISQVQPWLRRTRLHSDAVSGWMALASFFYVHKNYFASLSVINYAMQKCTDEKIFTGSITSEFTFVQTHVLNLMKNEKLYTVLKAVTIDPLLFHWKSSIIPQELQLVVKYNHIMYHPTTFAYFLSFLCYYHLHDNISCRHYLKQITYSIANSSIQAKCSSFNSLIMCGIAHQLMGETNIARMCFQIVDTHDIYKTTNCAASNFLNLDVNFE